MEKNSSRRILKVGIIGPESTGKSRLSEALAMHYKTSWAPEFAREYLQAKVNGYTQEDLEEITIGQLKKEQEATGKAKELVFFDTTALVLKVWSEHVFGGIGPQLQHALDEYQIDFHILTNTDIPWEYDPLREHPQLRSFFMDWYRREAVSCSIPYIEVAGIDFEKRLEQAYEAIDGFLLSGNGPHA